MQEMNNQLSQAIDKVVATGNLEGMKALSEALKSSIRELPEAKQKEILANLSARMGESAVEPSATATSTTKVVPPQVESPIETGASSVVERVSAIHELARTKSPETVLALIEALKDGHEDIRKAATGELVEALKHSYGDKSPAIVRALISSGDTVVPVIHEALKPQGLIERLGLDLLFEESFFTERRPRLRTALREIAASKAAAGELIETVLDTTLSGNARREAIGRLGKIKDSAAVPALCVALKDKDLGVRYQAAQALREIKDPAAVPALLGALKDKDSDVRLSAARALGEIKDPETVPALIEALKDTHEEVRYVAARALGEIGKPAVPALIEALKDKNDDVCWAAALALGEIKDRRAVEPLIEALKDENSGVRYQAARALWRIKDPRAVPALSEALKDKDGGVRWMAAEALGEIKDPAAVPALLEALKDGYYDVRKEAAKALGAIGDKQAIDPLRALLNGEQDIDVREKAEEALRKLERS